MNEDDKNNVQIIVDGMGYIFKGLFKDYLK